LYSLRGLGVASEGCFPSSRSAKGVSYINDCKWRNVRTFRDFDMTMVSMPQFPGSMALPYGDDADAGSSDAKSDVDYDLGLIRCYR